MNNYRLSLKQKVSTLILLGLCQGNVLGGILDNPIREERGQRLTEERRAQECAIMLQAQVKRQTEINDAIQSKSDDAALGLLVDPWSCSNWDYKRVFSYAIENDRVGLVAFLLSRVSYDLSEEKELAIAKGKQSILAMIQAKERTLSFRIKVGLCKLLGF